MLVYVSLAVAIVGLLIYGWAANAKLQEVGKLAYFAGLLAFLLQIGGKLIGGPR